MVDTTAGPRPFSVSSAWLNRPMSSQPIDLPAHPVVTFTDRLSARLDSLAEVPMLALSGQEQREVLVKLAKCRAQLETLRLRLLLEAEQSEATVESGAAT